MKLFADMFMDMHFSGLDFPDSDAFTLETLAAVIAHSQIVLESSVVAESAAKPAPHLPAGFDATDVAVLDWIVAEGRRLGRGIVQM
jgi:hypothetical protein